MKYLIVFVLFLASCTSADLSLNGRLVKRFTGVDGELPLVIKSERNEYHTRLNIIYLNDEGFKRDDIQIHEYLHWAYFQMTEKERAEAFAQWGTMLIQNRR